MQIRLTTARRISLAETVYSVMQEVLTHTCKMCHKEIRFTEADFLGFSKEDKLGCDQCYTDQFADLEMWAMMVPL
jgi:nitrate/TMAO reductase-like tetraheme cytochrome c subunit